MNTRESVNTELYQLIEDFELLAKRLDNIRNQPSDTDRTVKSIKWVLGWVKPQDAIGRINQALEYLNKDNS